MAKTKVVDFPAADKADEMVTVTETVTPEAARQYLDSMPAQRRIRQAKIRMLTRQVLERRWRETPHGIVFNRSGQMIDGQHRCTVICETGIPLVMRVTRNASDEAYLIIDSGVAPKSLDDALHHEGLTKSIAVLTAGAVRMLFREERGFSLWDGTLHPSNTEGIEVYRRHPDTVVAAELVARVKTAPSRSNLAYFVYKALSLDRSLVKTFVEGLITGEMLRQGDPALLLRNTWVLERNSRVRRTLSEDGIRIVTAINAALRGRKMNSWRGVKFGKGLLPQIGE